jgi:hypothetical protein
MDKNAAIRVDGMLIGVRGALDGVAHYMKNNFNPQEYDALVIHVGGAMAELIDISTSLHKQFPEIVPRELRPAKEQ